MKKTFITNNSKQTRKLGELLTSELRGGEIICLMGELGSGKTTFSQGILKGLGAKGPYTSPTFVVMKQYRVMQTPPPPPPLTKGGDKKGGGIRNIFHIDAYRVGAKDILALSWEEIIADKSNIIIVEWAERIKSIIPKNAIWMKFEYLGKNRRKIFF